MDKATASSAAEIRKSALSNVHKAIIGVALLGYLVAAVLAVQGGAQYEQYVASYKSCFYSVPGRLVDDGACNQDPTAKAYLQTHRQYYAIGEVFFNTAVLLTVLLILSYPVGMIRRRLSRFDPFANTPSGGTVEATP